MPEVKKLIKNTSAVSDVLGEVLMTTISVIFLSSIAVFVFSYGGDNDIPHTQVKGWTDVQNDTIYLENTGGESIDTRTLEIKVNINESQHTYSSSQIYANLGNRSSWDLGDRVAIDAGEWTVNIKEEDEIKVYLTDKTSGNLIQDLQLST